MEPASEMPAQPLPSNPQNSVFLKINPLDGINGASD
jgi:hypothetical protein